MRMYEELGEAVANDEIDTDEYQLSLQQQCSKYNLSLLVLNANSEVVADSGGGSAAAFTASVCIKRREVRDYGKRQ